MQLFKTSIIAWFVFGSQCFFAQQVIKTDTLSGTPLTVSMDKKISSLIESVEGACMRTSSTSDSGPDLSTTGGLTPNRGTRTVPSRALSTAEICRQNPRIMGVKIQLAVVKSNEEANEVKAYFRRRFPNIKVETDASLRPNYKILAGSYFSKESASSDLKRIREYFKSATAIQYRVFCTEAK
ncbi:SPOR domain-containing protein [Bergeyella sp. RCAD1439]|uniref:SPOR domain-containing protein n=1 Tax=Bergeyella anatis TaxID=3113737 RepID=UPI002E184472|nr:SPOR domain-containing protein [Bergeyella sp. RCAD1439]